MMKGYIRASKGLAVSERTPKQILPAVGHYSRQTFSQERSNPSIYSARYFGHKLHVDQNEKLVQFGVTCDGSWWFFRQNHFRCCQNNLIIYENIKFIELPSQNLGYGTKCESVMAENFISCCMCRKSYIPPEVTLQFPRTFRPLQPVTISLKEFGLNLISAWRIQ